MSLSLSLYFFLYTLFLSLCLFLCPPFSLSLYLSVCWCVCLSLRLYVSLLFISFSMSCIFLSVFCLFLCIPILSFFKPAHPNSAINIRQDNLFLSFIEDCLLKNVPPFFFEVRVFDTHTHKKKFDLLEHFYPLEIIKLKQYIFGINVCQKVFVDKMFKSQHRTSNTDVSWCSPILSQF
jgi:hypothetical protein